MSHPSRRLWFWLQSQSEKKETRRARNCLAESVLKIDRGSSLKQQEHYKCNDDDDDVVVAVFVLVVSKHGPNQLR